MPIKQIGLTGPSGAGKSVVSDVFASLGIPSIDTDALYHSLIEKHSPCSEEISRTFGPQVETINGGISRKALRDIVFHDKEKLAILNRITHEHIHHEVQDICKRYELEGYPMVIIDAPTLLDSPVHWELFAIVTVTANVDTRVKRIMARDGIDKDAAKRRVQNQHEDAFYMQPAALVLTNDYANKEEAVSVLTPVIREWVKSCGVEPGKALI